MRRFPIYAPKLIAKHVRIFVKGVIWVKDLGVIYFDGGKLVIPRWCRPKVKQAITEMNELILADKQSVQAC
ncbi:DUF1107 family protein [Parashewanella tropica]|uniref:DUF1107 family protein n=1 Tax=Parashewanella tropica TaxID=2547970 RepID=UPI0010598A83|nr:DUF1107 family protein [Parashewanella tropica]